jgi:hypothetical protein
MGYINIKITDIQIPNDFRVYVKPDDPNDGYIKPYPIVGTTWTNYGILAGMPIYSGGTTEIWLSGSTFDFQYGTTYWIRLEESNYPERYVIKNIRIFDAVAYEGIIPISPSATVAVSMSPTPSITRTATPTRSTTPTPTPSLIPVTPSMTPSIGSYPSPSPSTLVSAIYFASLTGNTGIMGVSNPAGRIFDITINYKLEAAVDNVWSGGLHPVIAMTSLFISRNGGSTWEGGLIDSITATVDGDTYPITQSDDQIKYGSYLISGITDVSQIRVLGVYDCAWLEDYKWGSVDVTITGVTVNVGNAVVICNNKYHVACLDVANLSCTGIATTPTPTPTVTPSITRTPSVTPDIVTLSIYNSSGADTNIANITIDGSLVTYPGYWDPPFYPGEYLKGKSPRGTGYWTVIVYIVGSSSGSKYMTLVDSNNITHCANVPMGATEAVFSSVYFNSLVESNIVFYSGGVCPSPPPGTPSVTRTVTPTMSLSGTPGASHTPTPSATPTKFGYYVDIYSCSGTACGNYISNAMIENPYYLTVGLWYSYGVGMDKFALNITDVAPLGGDVTDISGMGYGSCGDACMNA